MLRTVLNKIAKLQKKIFGQFFFKKFSYTKGKDIRQTTVRQSNL